jgi:hypothetical protein
MLGEPRQPPTDEATKQADPLPKTGAVCPQWVRCGRPTCRCSRGRFHGPYHCLFWREGGRLRKRYVRLADADAVRAACNERRRRERDAREATRAARQEWRALLALLKEIERHGHG